MNNEQNEHAKSADFPSINKNAEMHFFFDKWMYFKQNARTFALATRQRFS